jgi:hypothetical protein
VTHICRSGSGGVEEEYGRSPSRGRQTRPSGEAQHLACCSPPRTRPAISSMLLASACAPMARLRSRECVSASALPFARHMDPALGSVRLCVAAHPSQLDRPVTATDTQTSKLILVFPPIPSRYSPAAAQWCRMQAAMTRCLDRDGACKPRIRHGGSLCAHVGERPYKDVWMPGSRQSNSSHNTLDENVNGIRLLLVSFCFASPIDLDCFIKSASSFL